ncbi:MAG: hypothetical protein Q9182_001496 [Xanthomendoza sp. 2 TL-2023]
MSSPSLSLKRSAAPSPPPNQPESSKPGHDTTIAENIIFQGNIHLLAGRNRQAIELYTDVLYKQSPGHIIALLNRSLAYVCANPGLAVIDAYRAGILIQNSRGNNPRAHSRAAEIMHYLRTESMCVKAGHHWTRLAREPLKTFQHFEHIKWADMPLANLLIGENPDLVTNCSLLAMHNYYCNRLEARAIYLLCGALMEMSSGASHEALGLISDALVNCPLTAVEAQYLRRLGDGILQRLTDLATFVQDKGEEADDEHLVLLPLNGSLIQIKKPEVSAKNRVTTCPATIYWRDLHEPDYTNPKTLDDLVNFVATVSQSCSPFIRNQCGLFGLRASKDLYSGDTVLYERSPWHVTTSAPSAVLKAWQKNRIGQLRLYCDTCATALLLPDSFVTEMLLQAPGQRDFIKTSGDSFAMGNDVQDSKGLEHKKKVKAIASAHISFCHNKHLNSYCSATCRRLRRAFDPGIHEEVIETELRTKRIPTELPPLPDHRCWHPRHLYSHSKAQTIYDLLFLRIYAAALNENKHPLELTKFFSNNLFMEKQADSEPPNRANADTENTNMAPWSFDNNVVRPINSINRFHAALKQDPFEYLEQSDGWVIKTILNKIHRNVEISKGAMSAFTLNLRKESKIWHHRGFEPWVGKDSVYQSEQEFDEVWVGRIDPVVNMIFPANEALGEKPNCWFRHDQGIRVIAGQPGDPPDNTSVVIKKGETILRKRPTFLGGGPFEVMQDAQSNPQRPSSNGNGNGDEVSFDDDMNEDGEDEKSTWDSSEGDDRDAENATNKNIGDTCADSMDHADDSDELLDFHYTDSNPSSPESDDDASAESPIKGTETPPTSPPPVPENMQQPKPQVKPINKRLRRVLKPHRRPAQPPPDNGDTKDIGGVVNSTEDTMHPSASTPETQPIPRSAPFRNPAEAAEWYENNSQEGALRKRLRKRRERAIRKARKKQRTSGVDSGEGGGSGSMGTMEEVEDDVETEITEEGIDIPGDV